MQMTKSFKGFIIFNEASNSAISVEVVLTALALPSTPASASKKGLPARCSASAARLSDFFLFLVAGFSGGGSARWRLLHQRWRVLLVERVDYASRLC